MRGDEYLKAIEDQYAKLLAISLRKHRLEHIVITRDDIESAMKGGCNIIVQELDDGIHVRVVGDEEAIRVAKLEQKLNPPRDER